MKWSEVGGQRSEVRGKKSEVGDRRSEGKTESRKRKVESRNSESRKQKFISAFPISAFQLFKMSVVSGRCSELKKFETRYLVSYGARIF